MNNAGAESRRIPSKLIQSGVLSRLNRDETLTYLAVAAYANDDLISRPSYKALSRATGLSRRALARAVVGLDFAGLLDVQGKQDALTDTAKVDSDKSVPPLRLRT